MKTLTSLAVSATLSLATALNGQVAPATMPAQPGVAQESRSAAGYGRDDPRTPEGAARSQANNVLLEQRQRNYVLLEQRQRNGSRRAVGSAGSVLVIRSADSDPQSQANLEEDLAVMSHIFDNSLDEKLARPSHATTAMGIDVMFASEPDAIRTLYVDGYGALFMFGVDFPLLPTPKDSAQDKEKHPVNSTWEEAKRELYGQPPEGDLPVNVADEYNEDNVNKLKDALLESLKNATNIRGLKDGDFVNICVRGRSRSVAANGKFNTIRFSGGFSGANQGTEALWAGTMPENRADGIVTAGSILTIRVKKADVDAFANGKINLTDFRNKAILNTYSANSTASPAIGRIMR
jgi:hypothetical protein